MYNIRLVGFRGVKGVGVRGSGYFPVNPSTCKFSTTKPVLMGQGSEDWGLNSYLDSHWGSPERSI